VGFDCDVLCYDYYHIMGCPEWEDAEFEVFRGDHFFPQWEAIDHRHFERPRWFAQGPMTAAIKYLMARRLGLATPAALSVEELDQAWRDLERSRARVCSPLRRRAANLLQPLRSAV